MLIAFHAATAVAMLQVRSSAVRMAHVACDPRERRLLRGVMAEALEAQSRKRAALEEQQEAALLLTRDSPEDECDAKQAKARAKNLRRAAQIPMLLAEVDRTEDRLLKLKASLVGRADLAALRHTLETECGLASRLLTFDVDARARDQWGRPEDFDGLVVESPRGIPILIGRKQFSDAVLRRVARGTDLWFQTRDGSGSRVLLRTSMVRSMTRSPRECQEAAADLAAYFSGWRRADEDVEIIFTDSKHVAKRGARVGQMKDSKRLGILSGRPWRVAELAREAQEDQGWLDDTRY